MAPVQLTATIKSMSGRPSDPGEPPVVDMVLRLTATPELLTLFSGIGQLFDVEFTRRGEQLGLFDEQPTTADAMADAILADTPLVGSTFDREEDHSDNGHVEEAADPGPVEPVVGRRRR